MNSFAENPFLFFVDNVSPVYSVDACKDARRIVELTDAGCDARTPLAALPPNAIRYYSVKAPKVKSDEGSRTYYEDQCGNRSRKERYDGQNEWMTKNAREIHLVAEEHKNNYQHHWQKESSYKGSYVGDETAFPRRSNNADVRNDGRGPVDRTRTRRWNREEVQKIPRVVENEKRIPRDDHQTRKGSKAGAERPRYTDPDYPKTNSRMYDQEFMADREQMRPVEDYPEDFKCAEVLRNQSRSPRDYWQRTNTIIYHNADTPTDETSQKSQRCSRHNSANAKTSVRSSDGARHSDEARGSRIRSRTCSPPADRRKRTQPSAKATYQNVQQPDSHVESVRAENMNLVSSSDKLNRMVDRAVDKDSLPNVSNGSNGSDETTCKVRTDFWEFIPLNDEQDQKCRKIPEKIQQKAYLGSNSYPLTKRSMNAKDGTLDSKTKRRVVQKLVTDPWNAKSSDDSSPLLTNNKKNPTEFSRIPTKTVLDSTEAKLNPNCQTNRVLASKIPKSVETKEKAKEQNRQETKDQRKFDSKLTFGWTGKVYRRQKRPNSPMQSESNADRKKATPDKAATVAGDKKTVTSFVEKTAACLKRKLERSKTEEMSRVRCSSAITEKKIRSEGSKLPIRIGTRLRTANPAHRLRSSLEANTEGSQKTTGSVEDSSGQSSVRSRTKPKIKPSIARSRLMVESVEALESQVGNARPEPANRFENSQTGDSKSNNVDDKLKEYLEARRNCSRTKLSRDRRFDVGVDGNGMVGLNILNLGLDEKRNFVSRACATEANQRFGGKEKCFFHLNDEGNVVCDSYCKGREQRNVNAFRSRKIMEIRSRL